MQGKPDIAARIDTQNRHIQFVPTEAGRVGTNHIIKRLRFYDNEQF